jgi:uncharacterized protein
MANWLGFLGIPIARQRNKDTSDPYRSDTYRSDASTFSDATTDEGLENKKERPKRSLRKSVAFVFISCAACLFGVYLAMFPPLAKDFWDFMMFPPTKGSIDMSRELKVMTKALHCHFTDVFFNAPDGARLHAYYFSLANPKKTVLLSHGNGGHLQHRLGYAYILLRTGCSVFMYDYEGYGESSGSPDLPKVCQDGTAAFDYLTQQLHIKPTNIILFGESIGTGVSCEISQRRQAGGIILQSPFTSLLDAARNLVPLVNLYPSWSFPTPQLENVEILKKPHPPLLILHGKKDPTLPYRFAEEIMAKASPPKILIPLPHSGHNANEDMGLAEESIKKFVDSLP